MQKAFGLLLMSPVVTVIGAYLRFGMATSKEDFILQWLSMSATWLFIIGLFLFFLKEK